MSFTKRIALHDRITIDGTDYSNAFRTFNMTSDGAEVDVGGFSVSGVRETLTGAKTQGFAGDAYMTKETIPFLWSLHSTGAQFEVAWQPDGLVDNTGLTFHATCELRTFDPSNTFGDVSVSPLNFAVVDSISTT